MDTSQLCFTICKLSTIKENIYTMLNRQFIPVFILSLGLSLIQLIPAQAQTQTLPPLNCGDIVEAENSAQRPLLQYQLQIPAGTTLNARFEPLGQTVNVVAALYDSGDNFIFGVNNTTAGEDEVIENVAIATSNPTLAVSTYGSDSRTDPDITYYVSSVMKNFGAFTIYIGCTLRDGTVIAPGDTAVASGAGGASQVAPFSGFGFPGLSPVDFTNAIAIPFQMGDVPNVGSIAPGFESVFGFSFEGSTGDTLALDFTRLSGNMSLNLTVLSANNEVAYQASLVTSNSMSSTFTLPSSGTYTVGVSKSTVGAPATPENTTFQLTGTLNP